MGIEYECAGVIKEILSNVKDLVLVDCVALEPGISCWGCTQCKEGRYNLRPDMKFFATPPVHGSLANQVVHPVDLCFKLFQQDNDNGSHRHTCWQQSVSGRDGPP
ncbi:unnamed protein product [Lactuca saligna]|uniref:Alcohol dehydrogenase-like N-terminal domain-containing protein n=1 Tax=Lactuca saligna TaxID=75948 RepID=A0AA35VGQ9_LACSI|nr:unnamed protein product [Lactuca saligna]